MKSTLLFATLTMVFAMPRASALTELEALRAKCDEHERRIQRLEVQLQNPPGGSARSALSGGSATTISNPATLAAATYQVRRGDSLEKIARKNQCSVTTLAKLNHLKLSSIIHPGQNLKLPNSAKAQTAVPAAKEKASAPATLAGKTHKIQAGETYSSISRKHKVSVDSLLAANPGIKPTSLRPGQVIRLSAGAPAAVPALAAAAPTPRTTAPAAPAKAPVPATPALTPVAATTGASSSTPAPKRPIPANPPATPEKAAVAAATSSSQEKTISPNNPEKKIQAVTIEGEMTYGEFAAKHGTDIGRLNDLNGLDLANATVLAKGSELYVPAQP